MKPQQGCTRTATTGCTYTVFQEWNPASWCSTCIIQHWGFNK